MDNREEVTANEITQNLVAYWIIIDVVVGTFGSLFSSYFVSEEKMILSAIISVIIQGAITLGAWKISTLLTFRDKTMRKQEIPIVMKRLTIITIAICLINGIYNFSQVESIIEETMNESYELRVYEIFASYVYEDDEIELYEQEMADSLKEKCYNYLAILEVGITAVYLVAMPFEKKQIMKKIENT